MALTRRALELLAPHMRGVTALSFGYPDALISVEEAGEMFDVRLVHRTQFGLSHKLGRECVETIELFRALKSSLTCIDVMPNRDVEQQRDLNAHLGMVDFDLVIDAGTIEHCANIGQALMNAANAVAPRGVVFHSPPLSMVNHGFYNVSPTLLHDFYTQNGWEVLHLSGFTVNRDADFPEFDVHPTDRIRYPDNSALYFLARKPQTPAPLRWPTQTKYLKK